MTAPDRPPVQPREPVAVIGAGLIGRAWAIVFARAGHPVRLHDMDAATMAGSHAYIAERLGELADYGLLDDAPAAVLARIVCEPNMADALRDVVMVQENVRETVEARTQNALSFWALAPVSSADKSGDPTTLAPASVLLGSSLLQPSTAAAGARSDRPPDPLGGAIPLGAFQEDAGPRALLEPASPLSPEDDRTDRRGWP